MNGKKWNIDVGNINLKKPNIFLFLNFFVVFISLKVRSSLSFLDFLGIFSYKYERYKYRYIKYEQRSFSLTTQIHWSPKYQKIPKVSRNSKTKIYRKRFFFDVTPHFTVHICWGFFQYGKTSFLIVLSIQMVDNFLYRNHQGLVWWNSHLHCIPNIGAIKC